MRLQSKYMAEDSSIVNSAETNATTPKQRAVLALIGLYLLVQVLVPLRHWLYPGNVSWTEEGHRFAWHMKLRDKDARAAFYVSSAEYREPRPVALGDYLAGWQRAPMSGRPDMILQFAHHLADELRQQGHTGIAVRAEVQASLNGRERQLLIDPEVNLAAQPRSLLPASWILPLTEPLPGRVLTAAETDGDEEDCGCE